jgi:hypothetical protein
MKKNEKAKPALKSGSAPRAKLAELAGKLASGSSRVSPPSAASASNQKPDAEADRKTKKGAASGRFYQTYSLTKERKATLSDRQRELAMLALEHGEPPSNITVSVVMRLALVLLGDKMPGEIGKMAAWLSTDPSTEKASSKGDGNASTAFYVTKVAEEAIFKIEKAALMRGISLSASGLTRARMIEYALKEPFSKTDYSRLKDVEK